MTRPTDERPPPERRGRAQEGNADGSCTVLRHPKAPRQPSEQTLARLWIGSGGFALIVESLEGDARGRCKRRLRDERRTEDVDEITAAWRIVSARHAVEVYLTKEARAGAEGIERALALRARGVPVAFEPLDERTAREYRHEIAWANNTSSPLDKLSDTPFPVIDWMPDSR